MCNPVQSEMTAALQPRLASLLNDLHETCSQHNMKSALIESDTELTLRLLCESQSVVIEQLRKQLDQANSIIQALSTISATTDKSQPSNSSASKNDQKPTNSIVNSCVDGNQSTSSSIAEIPVASIQPTLAMSPISDSEEDYEEYEDDYETEPQ